MTPFCAHDTILSCLAADGSEGGKHQLIKATVNNGNLYIVRAQAGDKRWFKGADAICLNVVNSFTVA